MRLPAGDIALTGRPHFGQHISVPAVAGDGYMAARAYYHECPWKDADIPVS